MLTAEMEIQSGILYAVFLGCLPDELVLQFPEFSANLAKDNSLHYPGIMEFLILTYQVGNQINHSWSGIPDLLEILKISSV